MKFLPGMICGLLLLQPLGVQANFSEEPGAARVSAKHAKLRAKLRARKSDAADSVTAGQSDADASINGAEQQLNINGSDGCNLNVGNVLIDDTVRNPPDEVIVVIEGDIIQSNNCR